MPKAFFNRPALEAIQKARLDLAARKNADYGGRCDNIDIAGAHGLAVRIMDKATRLLSLTTPGQSQMVSDESIRDTFLDCGNYSDFGVSLLDGTWGQLPPEQPEDDLDEDADALVAVLQSLGLGGRRPEFIGYKGARIPFPAMEAFLAQWAQKPEGNARRPASKEEAKQQVARNSKGTPKHPKRANKKEKKSRLKSGNQVIKL